MSKLTEWNKRRKEFSDLKKMVLSGHEIISLSNGAEVEVFVNGFANPHQYTQPERERPVIFTLLNGRVLQFYRSAGRHGGKKGAWVPVIHIAEGIVADRLMAGTLIKYDGHHDFPAWIHELAERIKTLESEGKLVLHRDWDLEKYRLVRDRVFKGKKTLMHSPANASLHIPEDQLIRPTKVFKFGKIFTGIKRSRKK